MPSVILLLFFLGAVAAYPWIRAVFVESSRFAGLSTQSAFFIERYVPGTGDLARLKIANGAPTVGPPKPAFSHPGVIQDCVVESHAPVPEILRKADFYTLPPLLELEDSLGHDWARYTITTEGMTTSVVGLRSGGRNSYRFRRIEERILAAAGSSELAWAGCSPLLTQRPAA